MSVFFFVFATPVFRADKSNIYNVFDKGYKPSLKLCPKSAFRQALYIQSRFCNNIMCFGGVKILINLEIFHFLYKESCCLSVSLLKIHRPLATYFTNI